MNENNANFTPAAPNFKTLVRMSFQGLTNFPYIEEDFDALTNYGLLSKVVEYLNTVISNNNEQNTLMTNLYNAYVSLQDYVNNYFDNIDVQDEINNKLDEMTQDGSLTTLIANYVDPIYQQYESNINEIINNQNSRIESMDNKIDNVASGSPLKANSVNDMTDTSRIYVNTTDGKWYYYDGNSWEIGGVYQSSVNSDDVDNINNFLESCCNFNVELGKYIDTSGNESSNVAWKYIKDYIPISIIKEIEVPLWGGASCVAFYNKNKEFISGLEHSGQYPYTNAVFDDLDDCPENTYYIRCSYITWGDSTHETQEYTPTISTKITNIINDLNDNIKKSEKIDDIENMLNGNNNFEIVNDYYLNLSGVPTSNVAWKYIKDYIPISIIKEIEVPLWGGASCVAFYNRNKEFISGLDHSGQYPYTNAVFDDLNDCPENTYYIRCSYTTWGDNTHETQEYTPTINMYNFYEDYSNTIKNDSLLMNLNNLYGKKLVAIGDSMVKGHSLSNDKTCFYKIAKNNNMTYINYGVNGCCLSQNYYGQHVGHEDSVVDRYSSMDNDADYIIVFAGTNDINHSVTLGDENSTDATTFYGALNVLCQGLLSKYPAKKICFITPYARPNIESRCETYVNAIKTACKNNGGIPVFDNIINGGIDWTNEYQINSITLGDTYHLNETGQNWVVSKYDNFLRTL